MEAQKLDSVNGNIGVAVDLGSTTIAVCCMDMTSGSEIVSFSFPNPQGTYGADVITRIRHCIEDKALLCQMGDMVKKALAEHLREQLGTAALQVCRLVYSGNTTMLHILGGMSVEGLAAAPFTPVTLEYAEQEEELFSALPDEQLKNMHEMNARTGEHKVTVLYPPGFSAFVGADILTGAAYLKMGQSTTCDLLVDLGTNGELLLLNDTCGYAASTACGPVFDHAVTGAEYGSESIKAVANCVKRGLINSAGTIKEPFFEKGIEIDKGFVIRQQNVRNFQLAKGAIYAGIKCLLNKAGITATDIGNVYISGGLGFYMDIRDAYTVKMLPEEFRDKVKVSGNTSLEGAKKLLMAENGEKEEFLVYYEDIRSRTGSFELADLEGFQDIYIQALDF